MDKSDIYRMSLLDMAGTVKTKLISPVELIDAILQRIEKWNPRLNAYCTLTADAARERACVLECDLSFASERVALKDSYRLFERFSQD